MVRKQRSNGAKLNKNGFQDVRESEKAAKKLETELNRIERCEKLPLTPAIKWTPLWPDYI